MVTVYSHLAYLGLSIATTVWVARTLQRNGLVFLRDLVLGSPELADAVNNLLVVGFYLINFGYVALALSAGERPLDASQAIEVVSSKVGVVLLVLGAMHFLNLYIFSKLRKRALLERLAPPVAPQEILPSRAAETVDFVVRGVSPPNHVAVTS
jgi:hypothetical protein